MRPIRKGSSETRHAGLGELRAASWAAFCGLRWGELTALRRRDVDTDAGTVRVVRQLTEVNGQSLTFGPPKTEAGKRTVILPPMILADLRDHLASQVAPAPDALVFATRPVRRYGTATSVVGYGCPPSPLLA